MRFDFNGEQELTIGYKGNQPVKVRANGNGVYKNSDNSLSVDIDDSKLQGITLAKEFIKPKANDDLDLYGNPIPKAPVVTNTKPQTAVDTFKDNLSGIGKEIKRTANALWEDSIFGRYGTGASKEDKARVDVAKAQNTQGIIKSLIQGEEGAAENNKKIEQALNTIANQYGYDLGAIIEGNKIYFGKSGENGEIQTLDATPSFTNQIAASKGEIAGSILGSLLPGGVFTKIAGSAVGSGAGAGIDYTSRAQMLNEPLDKKALLMRTLEAAGDDLVAGGAMLGIAKGASLAKEPFIEGSKKAADIASKVTDFGLIGKAKKTLKGVPSANASGAEKTAKAIAGDEADLMLQNAKNVGGYTVDNGNFTDIQLLNKPIEFIKKHLAKTAEKFNLNKVSDFINNAKGVNEVQKELVDLGLSDSKLTGRVINSLRGDTTGMAARNLAEQAQTDVNAVRELLPKGAKGELSQNFKDYYARVGNDFGNMEQELSHALQGKTAILNDNAIDNAKEAMLRGMNTFEAKSPEAAQLIDVLDKMKGVPLDFDELRKIKSDFNQYAQKIFNKNPAYNTIVDTSSVGKIIDDAIESLIGNSEAKAYYKDTMSKYAAMKNLQGNPLLKNIIDGNANSDDILKAVFDAEKSQADVLENFTKELTKPELEKFEKELISALFDSRIAKRGKIKTSELLDGVGLKEDLEKINFRSKEAQNIKEALIDLANARGDLATIFNHIDKEFIAPSRPRAGIAQTPVGMLKSVAINKLKQSVFKYIGDWGDDSAFEYHLREGLKALKATNDLNYFKEAVIKKGASEELADAMAKAVKDDLVERMAKAPKNEIKGDNFITKESPAPKSDLNVKMDLAPNVRDLSKITTEEISADLDYLASKHPEMFSKPSDVFRLIREIKNEPTHFFNNNRLDYALIVKRMDENKIGKLAIDKESGEVKHATKVKEKDLKRLDKVSRENSKDAGIIQTFIQPGSKSNSELGLPNEIIPKQTQELDKTFKNQKDKNTKTINASPHIASGLLGGTANGADENGNVSPEEFAKGFIYALFGSKFSASAVKRISPELYNSILGLGKKMPQMAKDNPKLLTKIYGSAKSNSINSFAGEKALNASANKLSKAKAMLEKGEDEVKIWQSTGWYKDKDGAWKFEIDDSPAKIKNQNADKLGDLLEHKELFKAYPELKDIKIKKIIDEKVGKLGYYDPNEKEIALRDLSDKSTLMHEVQHAIQDVEGFAKGGGQAEARSFLRGKEGRKYEQELKGIDKTLSNLLLETQHMRMRYGEIPQSEREYEYAKELFRGINNNEKVYADFSAVRDDLNKKLFEIDKKIRLQDIQDTYKKIHGEAEARNVETRLNLGGKFRAKIVKDNNPVGDDYHAWIRNENDIKTFKQAYDDDGGGDLAPDFTEAMAKKAIDSGKITVYSSKPIKAGSFVTPSKMEAKSYAGSGKIYEEKLNLNDISWIDALQGQVTRNKDIHPHETFDVNPNETFVSRENGVNFSQKLPELKEKRGIYNVTYNGKFSTPVYKDLTTIDDAIKYAKGDKSKGAKHISIRHLNDENKEGYVTRQELLNLGENIRAYLKENKEPFIDKRGGHIYEWEDKDGVRFRAVIGQAKRESDDRSITSTLKPTDEATKSGITPNSSLYSSNDIITFYSDRNLKEPMKFENPKLKLLDAIDASSDKIGLVKKVLLNKDISDGVKAKAVNRLTKNKISQGVKNSYISTKNSNNN